MESTSSLTLEVAKQGFHRFQEGLATGKWEPFLEMLTEDCTFSFPAGSFKGLHQGKETLAKFLNYASKSVFKKGLSLTIERITHNEKTVIFEVFSEGEMWDKPYQNQAAIAFDIEGEKIRSYREYLGVVFTLPS